MLCCRLGYQIVQVGAQAEKLVYTKSRPTIVPDSGCGKVPSQVEPESQNPSIVGLKHPIKVHTKLLFTTTSIYPVLAGYFLIRMFHSFSISGFSPETWIRPKSFRVLVDIFLSSSRDLTRDKSREASSDRGVCPTSGRDLNSLRGSEENK